MEPHQREKDDKNCLQNSLGKLGIPRSIYLSVNFILSNIPVCKFYSI